MDNTIYPASSPMSSEISRRITLFVSEFLRVDIDEARELRRSGFLQFGTTLKWLEREKNFQDIERYLDTVHPPDVDRFLPELPGLKDMLRQLPMDKYILTNSTMEHSMRILDFYGIAECFRGIFDIRGNGMEGKPNESAYARVLQAVGKNPGDILLMDDVHGYLDGFSSLGGRCLLIDQHMSHPAPLHPRIPGILDLPAFLFPSE